MSADLVAFLKARLDEDEQVARRACEYAKAEWRLDEDGETVLWWPPEPRVAEKELEHGLPVVSDRWRGQTIGSGGTRIAPHIAWHDPARVLAEVEAKRELLRAYEDAIAFYNKPGNRAVPAGEVTGLWTAVRLAALPYASRPGYWPEWAPDA